MVNAGELSGHDDSHRFNRERRNKVERIPSLLKTIFAISKREGINTEPAATRMVEERIREYCGLERPWHNGVETALNEDLILVINPGSTSTKLALYRGETVVASASLDHSGAPWAASKEIISELYHRVRLTRQFLADREIAPLSLQAVVARGGLLRPVRSGVYLINEAMVADLENHVGGRHASNLGGLMAWEISQEGRVPSFIVDPVSVDEYAPEARLSGLPPVPRKSLLHALNIRACARTSGIWETPTLYLA